MAPGSPGVLTSRLGHEYSRNHGTSFSAPQVSAALAIMKQMAPSATVEQLINNLLEEAEYIPDNRSDAPEGATYPKLNIYRALRLLSYEVPTAGVTSSYTDSESSSVEWANNFIDTPPTDVNGVSTVSNAKVLQATTETYGNVAVVTASYMYQLATSTEPSPEVLSITYCGQPMTRQTKLEAVTNSTEIWTLNNPPIGNCKIVATFTKPAKEKNFVSTVVKDVDVGRTTSSGGQTTLRYQNRPIILDHRKEYSGNTINLCSMTTHPEYGQNISSEYHTKGQ